MTPLQQMIDTMLFEPMREHDRAAAVDDLLDALAATQHEIWSHWMKYLFSICQQNQDRSVTISSHNVARWQRQIRTEYADLTEQEKVSDRNQAKKVLATIRAWQDEQDETQEIDAP